MWMNRLSAVLIVSAFCVGWCLSHYVATPRTVQELSSRKQFSDNADHFNHSRKIQTISTGKHYAGRKTAQKDNTNKDYNHNENDCGLHEPKKDTREPHGSKTRKRKRKSSRVHYAVDEHSPHAEKMPETQAGRIHRLKDDQGKHEPAMELINELEGDENHKSHADDLADDHPDENQQLKGHDPDKTDKQFDKENDTHALHNLHGDKAKSHARNYGLSKKALNSLRNALIVHPFKIWKFKGRFQSMDDLGIHEAQLHDIIDNKWNKRLKHKLYKVLQGKNIHLAIIGGSNTAGGGLQEEEGGTEGVFFRVISDWWRKTVTPITGSRLKMRQIAMGGTASDFFQYCFKVYIQENVDIVLLEMSVNDLKQLPPTVNLSLPIEQLTRQLLEFPTQPALIYVNLLSGRSYYQGCLNLEDFGQRLLSDVYNITTFSWRDAVCPKIDGKFRVPLKSCGVVCKDGHHINQLGHAHVSLMIINLLRDLLLDSISHVDKGSGKIFNDKISLPQPVFIKSPSKIITSPICWTTISPNYKKTTINNSMDVGVMENFGFDYLHNARIGGTCDAPRSCRGDAYSGWSGKEVGASLTLSFAVPALEHNSSGLRSRSVAFATRTCNHCGAVEVWLDDDYLNRRLVNGKSNFYQTSMEIVAFRVNPGDHTMSVHVVGAGDVTVVGVMLGPPDGPY